MMEPKSVRLDDRDEFDAFCRKHLASDAERISLLVQVRGSKHPQAKAMFDQLCEAYHADFGTWPKLPELN